ncbi:leukocyte immunoglobulin-like receptor subfamily B member 2 isoform X2 [Silurus meridionalis]|uniref:leukocyte immunoglobulin-like receptor subfamily B member 2 isoform X2 n=1 Tax=Silurus meridionalis TaxID=175797 RepID=UPI001EEB401D|nr:leukocyte immunoglobulin-like receptor subfamily B member 2 isoform X2 [Silurus meridionalis]
MYRMELGPLAVMFLLVSHASVAHTQAKPKPTIRVTPQSSIYTGDTITLSCELQETTAWEFIFYKNYKWFQLLNSKQANSFKVTVNNAGEIVYQCRARSRNYFHYSSYYNNYYYYTEFSKPVKITVRERPQAVLSVSPQNWLTEGDSVTLSCEVTDSSTDWTFSWYTVVPYRDGVTQIKNTDYVKYVELLSDSSRGSGGSYTLSPSALHHTGVYVCRGERGEPAIYTHYSNTQPLWISDESPPVSLIISPSRTQHFTHESLSLSCEDQSNSTGWTVRRYTDSKRMLDCSWWGSVTGSTCSISFLSTSYTGVYWCESESGENSNPVNITVHDGDVILESSVHPVTEGHPLTLRCLYHNTNPSNLRADFYKDGSVVQNQTTGEMIIHKVSKSDEGFYHCKYPERGASLNSWISVRQKQQKSNQESQSGHKPLQTGNEHLYAAVDQADTSGTDEAASGSSEAIYAQVIKKKKAKKNNGADAELDMNDVTYAEIRLKPMKKEKRAQEKTSVGDDTVYSELHQNMKYLDFQYVKERSSREPFYP